MVRLGRSPRLARRARADKGVTVVVEDRGQTDGLDQDVGCAIRLQHIGDAIEEGKAHFGRLAGVAVAKDGALLFSDDANGMIYHVAYLGAGKERETNKRE